jgi:hypothetical protein
VRQIYRPKRTFQFDPFLSDGSPDAKSASILLRSLVASTTDGGRFGEMDPLHLRRFVIVEKLDVCYAGEGMFPQPSRGLSPSFPYPRTRRGLSNRFPTQKQTISVTIGGNCVFLPSWECSTPPTLDLPFTFMSMLHAMSGRFHIEGPTLGQLIELHGHWRTTALFTGRHAPAPHKSPQALRLMLHPCCRLTCPESRKGANAVIETFIQYPYALTNWTIGLWMSNFFGLAHITTLHSLLQFGNVSKVAVSPGH